ncbi:MAG TPA: efflux RND transporter periplasmic adaptor subunit [Planctomycetota bacterium]|nr:efflux RND transporter periplasmic adaptor subunit [Planctomycetota bacterium]
MRVAAGAVLAAVVLLTAGAARSPAGEGPGKGRPDAGAPVPVKAAVAEKKAMPVEIGTFGTVEANATVTIKPQVTGVIREVLFRDGQAVTKGGKDSQTGETTKPTPLFKIDDRPFQAELDRANAQLENAQNEFNRQKELTESGGTTKSAMQQADANLKAAQAAVKSAALNVEYCTINSPIDGRAGACLVDAGNLVKSGDAALVVINQIRPVQVSFSVPQQNLAEIRKRMAEGVLKANASIPGQPAPETETGELTFVDNAVDRTTGTIRLTAVFDNQGERLWPGQFVTVRIVLRSEPDAVVVPSAAVQNGQKGQYVFVIKDDGTAENRPVTVDRELGTESVISRGLAAGERVVTDGQLRILPGAKVSVVGKDASPEMPKAGGAGKGETGEPAKPAKSAKPGARPGGVPGA